MPQRTDLGAPTVGRPKSWWPDLAALAVFVVVTWLLFEGHLLRLDVDVRNWVDSHRPTPMYVLARIGNLLGQGGFLALCSLVLSIVLARRWRTWRVMLPVITAFALTFITLTWLKAWTDRAAPHATIPAPEALRSGGVSYPSGHLTNAFVWYGLLAMLLPLVFGAERITQRWIRLLRWVPPAVLMVTTTYLGYHWVTDSVAGLALGIVLDRLRARLSELKRRPMIG